MSTLALIGCMASSAQGGPVPGTITVGSNGTARGVSDGIYLGVFGSCTHPALLRAVAWGTVAPNVLNSGAVRITSNVGIFTIGGTDIDLSTFVSLGGGVYRPAANITLASSLSTFAGASVPYTLTGVPGI